MGMRQRIPWLSLVELCEVPEGIKMVMRAEVLRHDQMLSATLGAIELVYLRAMQSVDAIPREEVHQRLLERLKVFEERLVDAEREVMEAQAARARAIAAADADLDERAERARIGRIADLYP